MSALRKNRGEEEEAELLHRNSRTVTLRVIFYDAFIIQHASVIFGLSLSFLVLPSLSLPPSLPKAGLEMFRPEFSLRTLHTEKVQG